MSGLAPMLWLPGQETADEANPANEAAYACRSPQLSTEMCVALLTCIHDAQGQLIRQPLPPSSSAADPAIIMAG